MPSIAVTGSIGSGKSVISELLSHHLPSVTYCADKENSRLLESDPEVRREIIALLGSQAYGPDGRPDRSFLRTSLLASPSLKKGLEEILHPRLRAVWEPLAAEFRTIRDRFLIAEIPLLFENHLEDRFDITVAVATSPEIAAKRLAEGRNIPPSETASWRTSQLSQEEKISRAGHVVWNDGTLDAAESQVALLAKLLKS